MQYKYSKSIKRTFDYLKIANDDLMTCIELHNEHIDNAKVKIAEAIEELALGYGELK